MVEHIFRGSDCLSILSTEHLDKRLVADLVGEIQVDNTFPKLLVGLFVNQILLEGFDDDLGPVCSMRASVTQSRIYYDCADGISLQ